MEIKTIKNRGCEVTAIFTGGKYFFHNSYYGVVCIAERTSEIGEISNVKFNLYVGNNNCVGSSYFDNGSIIKCAKRHISKEENKYVKCDVKFNVCKKDLSKGYIAVNFHEYA